MKELIWEITNDCLNNCRHCSSMLCDSEGMHSFDPEIIAAGVKVFKTHGFNHVILSGGEPGLHPHLDLIIDSIAATGADVSMYTSGVYGDDFFKRSKLSAIRKLHKVFISFYSSDPKIHEELTGKVGSFSIAMDALAHFVLEGVNVEANIVPMNQNQADLDKTAVFLLDRGVNQVNFLKLVQQGNAEKNWDAIRPNYEQLETTLECVRSNSNVRVGTPFGQQKTGGQFCGAGYKKICISYDGFILPCEVFKRDRKKFPNIYANFQELDDIISSFSRLSSISESTNISCFQSVIKNKLML